MESVITEYIDALIKFTEKNPKQNAFYRWLKENGKLFKSSDRDMEAEETILSDMQKRGIAIRPKFCFYNSQIASIFLRSGRKLEYYEGYYVSKIPIALEHGFLVIHGKREKLVDLTSFVAGVEVDEYFGVAIPYDYISSQIAKTSTARAILARYFYDRIYPLQSEVVEEVI